VSYVNVVVNVVINKKHTGHVAKWLDHVSMAKWIWLWTKAYVSFVWYSSTRCFTRS